MPDDPRVAVHVLVSPKLAALGVRHGFNLRHGGHSVAPFDTFNLGRSVGDSPEAVASNHAAFARALGVADGALFTASQVHGASARVVGARDEASRVRLEEADVLIAREPGIAIGVSVADCVPVLLVDRRSGAVAAVHAGWRGVVARAIEVGLRGIASATATDQVYAAIFPHIGPCCFEVGEEVATPLAQAGAGEAAIDRSRAKPHIDLARIVRAQLEQLGIAADHIDRVPGCTRCEPERFFSFRRDGKRSGRHIGAIVSPG